MDCAFAAASGFGREFDEMEGRRPRIVLSPDRVIGHFDQLWDAVEGLSAVFRVA
jgi:hypothetical protein